jgi:biotin-(acetyl-CoA carboxylase) ligase
LLAALDRRRPALVDPSAGAALIAELRARCATLGRRVRVELPNSTFEGTAVDVTEHGLLVVDTAGGMREVAAGDVVHVRTALAGPGGPLN